MPTKARGKQVAPMIRGAFIRAVKGLEDGGRPLSTIIKEQLEEDPLGTLRAVGYFVPKELMATTEDEDGNVLPLSINVTFRHADSD